MTKYYCRGAVVKSIAGRESGELFIIMNVDKDYAYLANGKSRPIESPKKKNFKHLHLLCKSENSGLDLENITNAHLIKYLKDYYKSRDYK